MIIKRISNFIRRYTSLPAQIYRIQEALGRIEQRQITHVPGFRESEFRVFSQWGEDGIIQFLLRHVLIERPLFVEFGVEDYIPASLGLFASLMLLFWYVLQIFMSRD